MFSLTALHVRAEYLLQTVLGVCPVVIAVYSLRVYMREDYIYKLKTIPRHYHKKCVTHAFVIHSQTAHSEQHLKFTNRSLFAEQLIYEYYLYKDIT